MPGLLLCQAHHWITALTPLRPGCFGMGGGGQGWPLTPFPAPTNFSSIHSILPKRTCSLWALSGMDKGSPAAWEHGYDAGAQDTKNHAIPTFPINLFFGTIWLMVFSPTDKSKAAEPIRPPFPLPASWLPGLGPHAWASLAHSDHMLGLL